MVYYIWDSNIWDFLARINNLNILDLVGYSFRERDNKALT